MVNVINNKVLKLINEVRKQEQLRPEFEAGAERRPKTDRSPLRSPHISITRLRGSNASSLIDEEHLLFPVRRGYCLHRGRFIEPKRVIGSRYLRIE